MFWVTFVWKPRLLSIVSYCSSSFLYWGLAQCYCVLLLVTILVSRPCSMLLCPAARHYSCIEALLGVATVQCSYTESEMLAPCWWSFLYRRYFAQRLLGFITVVCSHTKMQLCACWVILLVVIHVVMCHLSLFGVLEEYCDIQLFIKHVRCLQLFSFPYVKPSGECKCHYLIITFIPSTYTALMIPVVMIVFFLCWRAVKHQSIIQIRCCYQYCTVCVHFVCRIFDESS